MEARGRAYFRRPRKVLKNARSVYSQGLAFPWMRGKFGIHPIYSHSLGIDNASNGAWTINLS